MSDEMKQMKKQLKEQVRPLVAMLFKESISGKIVVASPNLEHREVMTPGPYWVVYNCIEHMTGVQTLPVTLGRFWPDMTGEFIASLQSMGNLISLKERDRFTGDEVALIYATFVELIKESFTEVEVVDGPGAYFDACCKMFPGEVTTKMRQDFVSFQSRKAAQGEIAGADGS